MAALRPTCSHVFYCCFSSSLSSSSSSISSIALSHSLSQLVSQESFQNATHNKFQVELFHRLSFLLPCSPGPYSTGRSLPPTTTLNPANSANPANLYNLTAQPVTWVYGAFLAGENDVVSCRVRDHVSLTQFKRSELRIARKRRHKSSQWN